MKKLMFVLFTAFLTLPVYSQINQGGGGGDSVELTPETVLKEAEDKFMNSMKYQWPKCSKTPVPEDMYKLYEVVSKNPKDILKDSLKDPKCPADKNELAACLTTDVTKTKLKAVVESEYFMLYMVSKYKIKLEEYGRIATFYKAILKEE